MLQCVSAWNKGGVLKLYESGYVVLMCLENGDFVQMVIKASKYKKIDK